MDTVDFLKERDRMCKENADCEGCPGEGTGHRCMVYLLSESNDISTEKAERIVAIVKEWSKEHPRKTMKQDFFEKFPNAPTEDDDDIPTICPYQCGYARNSQCDLDMPACDCHKCWSRPVEE